MSPSVAGLVLVPMLLGGTGRVTPRDTTGRAARIAVVADSIEAERKRLGVPGAAVAIVQDGRLILLQGFGHRDLEAGLPVTPRTLFSIGSCTKPFTALATAISADQGLLSLDDSPKKFLPWFALRDADADARVTLRDLLSHRTGVPDDLPYGWYERYPSHAQLIRAAMGSRPNAAFRTRFNYNNYMFLAVGEALAVVHHAAFEAVMASRVLTPLGMRSSTLSIDAMRKSADFSYPYGDGPRPRRYSMDTLAFLAGIAPAGGIVSNAEDMAQWLRLMLAGGVLDGKRLVSERGLREMETPAVPTGGGHYGLGLFIEEWHGHRVYYHPGGVPGFGTRCEFVPDLGLGWVVLTNVDDNRLPKAVGEIVYARLVAPR